MNEDNKLLKHEIMPIYYFLNFANKLKDFYQICQKTYTILFHQVPLFISKWLGRNNSPYRVYLPHITRALLSINPSIDKKSLKQQSNYWLESHGIFCISIFKLDSLDSWLLKQTQNTSQQAIEKLAMTGGLVLSYHTFHHNLLLSYLGIVTHRPVFVFAAPEKNCAYYPYIGKYTKIINSGTQRLFNGGDYLFTDNLKKSLSLAKKALQKNEIVISLNDNPAFGNGVTTHCFMGKKFSLATGSIRMALEQEKPIYASIFYPDLYGKYIFQLIELKTNSVHSVTSDYLNFLQTHIFKSSYCWQGLFWFADLENEA